MTIKVSVCSLNQWSMDFLGNKERILESIIKSHQQGCTYRLGPELETSGYSCQDHFYEIDTIDHSWEIIAAILP